ncbi:conserved hypothetical protein [Arthrobacter sp. Hiyo8]|nr:conserved hypothetical protein [Arthrobacter sp. Hiyo8]
MWSAVLQEFPDLSVVLLLDDPPFPADPDVLRRLEATRALAGQITETLKEPAARVNGAYARYRRRRRDQEAEPDAGTEVERLIAEYQYAAEWLEAMAETESVEDHVDEFFVDLVLMGLARELRLVILALTAANAQRTSPGPERIAELYARLTWIFNARVSTFERKRFASLSHEANKAMNLNAYLSLMGGTWHPEQTADGTVLRPAGVDDGDVLSVPDTTYVLTLDADSMLLRDYCLRLVHLLESPGNEKVAVTQTPYSSFRGAPTRIERIAGATTDIQHIQHQGMTQYGATFWVGANAVIRKRALEDIVEISTVGGFEVRTYIQDRTVIEDTESSVDLGKHGWTLANYPERLSYSATPPDFGSLVVQRRRWPTAAC